MDKVVTSRAEVLSNFDAGKAKVIRDNKLLRARRDLERRRIILESMVSSINSSERRATDLAERVATVESDIDRINKLNALDRENIPRGYYRSSREEFALRDLVELHTELTARLVVALKRLLADYDKALAVAEPYPDLNNYFQAITNSIETARAEYEAKYKEVTFPSRERYLRRGYRDRDRRDRNYRSRDRNSRGVRY